MPLCSVEVPRGAAPEVIQEARELARESLEIVHEQLEVPDAEDLEINVIEGEGKQAKLFMSFTVGPDEYGYMNDIPDPSFYPEDGQITAAGKEIQAKAKQSDLRVAKITIEAWENTTFIPRNLKAPEPTPPGEDLKEISLSILNPQLRLIVSPEKQHGPTGLPREAEPITEPESNLSFIEGVGRKLSEALGLPEDSPIPVHVQPTLFADTDFAVEFDCRPISGYQISEEARTYIAQLIEQELNKNPSTQNGSAEVWVRQGQPVAHHFTSK